MITPIRINRMEVPVNTPAMAPLFVKKAETDPFVVRDIEEGVIIAGDEVVEDMKREGMAFVPLDVAESDVTVISQ